MSREFLLERMTWKQARTAFGRTSVVVIPIGSTEQHGPHLPLGTDFMVAEEMARRIGERADVIVTPTIPIGYAQYHTYFHGTLSVSEKTLARMLIEVCENLLKYGTTHILFVDGHGGNLTALRQCGEALRQKAIPCAIACWWDMTQVVNPEWLAIGHADYIETAAMLALDESLVDMAEASLAVNKQLSDEIALDNLHVARFREGTLTINLVMPDITDRGDMMEYGLTSAKQFDTPPQAATKEMGEQIFEGLADYLADFVEAFRKVKLPPVDQIGPIAG